MRDLKNQKFSELIKHPYVSKFKELVPDECDNCENELRNLCLGGCRAAAEACYGCLGIDPIVKLIEE